MFIYSRRLTSYYVNYFYSPMSLTRSSNMKPTLQHILTSYNIHIIYNNGGPGSSVGIATDYGLDGPVSNPGGDEIFLPSRPAPGAHPASCTMGTGSFPGVKCGRGVLLTTHPLLVPWSWKNRAIPLPTLWATPDL